METFTDASVILPAGGCGERFGTALPKQYCEIQGQPLIVKTIQLFHKFCWINKIVVVINPIHKEFVKNLLHQFNLDKVILAIGDSTRHRSIFNGLKTLYDYVESTEVVIIHDAVRPFVEDKTIIDVTRAASEHGAAGVICPLVSTVVAEDSNGFLETSLDRNKYRASEMPQAFILSSIFKAYKMATDYDLDYGTECLLFAKKYAQVPVKLISGPKNLWKVTHRKDLHAAEGIIKEETMSVKIVNCLSETMTTLIANELKTRNVQNTLQVSNVWDPLIHNSFIFCYNTPNWEKVERDIQEIYTSKSKDHMFNALKYVVIHVIFSDNIDLVLCSWRKQYKLLAEKGKNLNVLLQGVICLKTVKEENLSKWIVANLWAREDGLSGFMVAMD